ncbi:MAG TPA: NAD-dependent epimerase/dehydratase family protein, partial [Gemmatimonadales bacterium]|nr:NAD-dependent epimerase/dehydratase family protein [Gemmatimonadales bacterium]
MTGGAGFIGANFVRYWLERHPGDRIVVLDALTYAGNLASLEPVRGHAGYAFVQGDIRTPGLAERLLREQAVDTVVH